MKKWMSLLLIAALALSVTACGPADDPAENEGSQNGQSDMTSDLPEKESGSVEEEVIQEQEKQMAALSVQAMYEEDAPQAERDSFREEPTDYDQGVVFRAVRTVTDFRFFVVEWAGEEEGWGPLEGESLYTWEELEPGQEVLVVTSFPGDMPSRGISYTENGVHKAYTLSTSGLDGSLILDEIEA